MSQCEVPSWNLRYHRQGLNQGKEGNKPSHVDSNSYHHHLQIQQQPSFSHIVSMPNYEVTELTWEKGQPALHELGGIFPPPTSTSYSPPKPTWVGAGRASDTLESIVHQATYCNKQSLDLMLAPQQASQSIKKMASTAGKWVENSAPMQTPIPLPPSGLVKKRTRSESENHGRNNFVSRLPNDHESTGASGNVVFSIDNNDTTMMTWASLESPKSCTRTKTTTDEDSACPDGSENQEEEKGVKGETGRSYNTRKGRAAAVHNQSERRRRERINQKMKALQKLVPNASKTDKASMLDEVIEYLKQLQAQVQAMSNASLMSQIMLPLGMQQQLHQMSLLARMGMGQAIPQLIHPPTQTTSSMSPFVPPTFAVPQIIPTTQQSNTDLGAGASNPLQNPYGMLLAQSMSIDLYNRMAALQKQQQTQAEPTNDQMKFKNHIQGD